MTPELEKLISNCLLTIQVKAPFFATLALFTRFYSTRSLDTAATDGKNIFINPDFAFSLSLPQLKGVLLHEILHAALLHITRRGNRDHLIWNIAADIVVNGMIIKQAELMGKQGEFELPKEAICDQDLEHLSVEEVYEIILQKYPQVTCLLDLLEGPPHDVNIDNLSGSTKNQLEHHWRNAMQQAVTIDQSRGQGNMSSHLKRELGQLLAPQLDWRSYLWRYLVKTPTDFSGFDRRFIGQKLYLEALESESVTVYVCIDTSGSVNDSQLQLFLSEVLGIINSYPYLKCQLYYADADAYGPYELDANTPIPEPVGGGGTSFIPFFEKVTMIDNWDNDVNSLCVYLTDGCGVFPSVAPSLSVLWIVTPHGIDLDHFPFGEAVRLLSN